MVEVYLAYLLICGFEGNCKMFGDKTSRSFAIADCQKKLDEMWVRVRAHPKGVEKSLGEKFSFVETPRGFCLHSDTKDQIATVSEYYNL